ncbi:helix-turn-helix domain-containing protein [Sunxiuqinia sp. sy24]|uniref:helix-turn-helix domain-containing protein n=1 Tax=Sunxiuqinia sp. sy24 TaxID=3461495 RepID=UPI004045BD10
MENPFISINERLDRLENTINERLPLPTHACFDTPPLPPPDEFFFIDRAADFLGLSIPTVYSKSSKGELPVIKRGKRLYFSRNDLLEYLRKGRRMTNEEIEEKARKYTG